MQNKDNKEIILSIDPGYERCGLAIFENSKEPILITSECIRTDSKTDHAIRLQKIFESVSEKIKIYKPTIIAIETLFFSMNKKTAIKVSEARGVVLCAAAMAHLEVLELSPQAIKLSLTGSGNADKNSIQKMVSRILKKDISKMIDDEIDAIAIGLASIEELRVKKLMGKKVLRS